MNVDNNLLEKLNLEKLNIKELSLLLQIINELEKKDTLKEEIEVI